MACFLFELISAILKIVSFVLKIGSLNKSGKSGKNIQWILSFGKNNC